MQGTVTQHLSLSFLENCLAVRTQPNATTLTTPCVHKEYWDVIRLGGLVPPRPPKKEVCKKEFKNFFFFFNPGQYHKSEDCMGKTTLIL